MVRLETPPSSTDVLLKEYEQSGCPRAFEQLVADHRAYVRAICERITGNAHDADDAAQAVFLTLALQSRDGNSIRSLKPWLAQVARHVSLDLCKARRRRTNHETAAKRIDVGSEPDSPLAEAELQQLVRSAIDSLPAIYRAPMILFYFGGLSLPAIGRQLGVRGKTLSVRLLRGRRMLAEHLTRSRYPLFSAAALPVVVNHVVQSISPASYLPAASGHSHLFSSLGATLVQVQSGLRLRRQFAIAVALMFTFSGVAGSASLVLQSDVVPASLEIPSIADWISRKLQLLPRLETPKFLQNEEPPTKPGKVKLVVVPPIVSPLVAHPLYVAPPSAIPTIVVQKDDALTRLKSPSLPANLSETAVNRVKRDVFDAGNENHPAPAISAISRLRNQTHETDDAAPKLPDVAAPEEKFTPFQFAHSGDLTGVWSGGLNYSVGSSDGQYASQGAGLGGRGNYASPITSGTGGFLDSTVPPAGNIGVSDGDFSSVGGTTPGIPEPAFLGVLSALALLGMRKR